LYGLGPDGIDVGAEELGALSEELEDGDTARALGEGEDFDEVGYKNISNAGRQLRPVSGVTHCMSAR